jgi:hypothetical protein
VRGETPLGILDARSDLNGTGTFTRRSTVRASASACEFVRPLRIGVRITGQSVVHDRPHERCVRLTGSGDATALGCSGHERSIWDDEHCDSWVWTSYEHTYQ